MDDTNDGGIDAAIAAAMKEVGGTENLENSATDSQENTGDTENPENSAAEDQEKDGDAKGKEDDTDDDADKTDDDADNQDDDADKTDDDADNQDDDADNQDDDKSTDSKDNKGSLKAPIRWEKKWKDNFSKLPDDAKKLVLEQHRAWAKGMSAKAKEVADARSDADRVITAIPEGVRKELDARKIAPEAVVARLFERWQLSEADPAKFISDFLVQKKIDPAIFVKKAGEDGKDPAPAVHEQLAPILEPLLQKIAQLEQNQSAAVSRQQAHDDEAIEAAILSVRDATDEDGNPMYPYLEDVENEMVTLLNAGDARFAQLGPRERLIEAYNLAVYMNPGVREEIVSADAQKRAAALEQSRLNKRLGKAATTKPKTSGQMTPKPATSGIDAAFSAALKEVGG